MRSEFQTFDFPKQRVPNSEKDEVWAANSCDWVIAQGQGRRNLEDVEKRYNILNGFIPDEAYAKILNPYNSTKDKYKRFPATMRHYDLMKGIIRRYVGEYIKDAHDFIVGANNPEVVLARNAKLKQELNTIVQQKIAAQIQQNLEQWINQGQDPKKFDPKQSLDVDAFIKKFNQDYIDDISEQGQNILNVIRDITEDALLYARAYFDFVTFGECYTYSWVRGNNLFKKNIAVRDAFPIPTDNFFVEDDDMFSFVCKMTYQQIIDEFDESMKDKDRTFLDTYYAKEANSISASYAYSVYESYFPETSGKFTNNERKLFKDQQIMARDNNADLYDVWYAFWRGEVRQALVTYINESSLIDTRIEKDDYKLNRETGDLSIDYVYQPQVYEAVRIGGRNDAIYPYGPTGARAIDFNRNGKLPVNGIKELIPGFGKFSIIDIVYDYNVFYDIVAYNREMAIARNKLSILMIAKSLLGKVPEETIYKMIADGVLYVDDDNDQGMLRAQQVRMIQASNSEYINQLTNLLVEIKQAAQEQVDMTPQRYGEIANSAGKGTTDEAITRGSMGSVIIVFIMDYMREHDYARDMDFSKFAWIDGLTTSYKDTEGKMQYISLDVDSHNYADYIIKAKGAIKEREKLDQFKQLAFSAAQNGDILMATAAIEGDNVATISKLMKQYQEQKDANDQQIKQLELQEKQIEQDLQLRAIAAKGDEERKTLTLKGQIDAQIELIKADANMVSFDNGVSPADKDAGMNRLQQSRNQVEREKIQSNKEDTMVDSYNKFEDRKLKQKDIDTKLQIAKLNKNRFDFTKKR